MSSNNSKTIIVGAGLAGLAVSRQLHRAGLDVLTLEKRPAFAAEGFAINLPGNAIAALEQLGLGPQIAQIGSPTKRREYRDQRGKLLFDVDEDAFWGPIYRPRCVKRADLSALLRQDMPDTVFRMASEVEAITLHTAEVLVTDSNTHSHRGHFLIGADGVHSRVRALHFDEINVRTALLSPSSWRFIAPDPGIDCWTVWAGASALFLLIPLGNGEVYGWASVDAAAAEDGDGASLAYAFRQFPAAVRETARYLDANPLAAHHSPLEEVRMETWSRDRLALIGDAAHATAPVWAQGAAMAFEDANVLAHLLVTTPDWSRVGALFEAARRPRVEHVQAMTDKMSRAARLPSSIRNLILPFVGPKTYRATYGPLRQ
jgi:2-polyprenyl-6-methoxyphenol hydroxylase-like FAD-dependent oxidoreductase